MAWEIKYHPLAKDDIGIRVVYKLVEDEETHDMYILVISASSDNEVYDLAGKRKSQPPVKRVVCS